MSMLKRATQLLLANFFFLWVRYGSIQSSLDKYRALSDELGAGLNASSWHLVDLLSHCKKV